MKSSVEEIRQRFDADVERFSDLETGQQAAVDSPECLELIAEAAAVGTPDAQVVLDIGCGAGNYALKYLETRRKLGLTTDLQCRLCDLSQPMLRRAGERIKEQGLARIETHQCDVRELTLPSESVDVILAAAVFHHLRTPAEWAAVFGDLFRWLRPGGSVWIYDMVESPIPALAEAEKERYGRYLSSHGGEQYRDKVFAYIEKEDTPASLTYQLELLTESGFDVTEVLHKKMGFAAFGALKRGPDA